MSQAQVLIAELDTALGKAPVARQRAMLRNVTDLFLHDAERYSSEQVAVFDNIMCRLIDNADRGALIELSAKLAPVGNAPVNTIGRLSCNDEIAIAGAFLEKSESVRESDLVEVAKTKSQAHLMVIAGRPRISEPVTDVLVERGDSQVVLKVIANEGARFSEMSFVRLIKGAATDKTLAATVAKRTDVPAELRPFFEIALT
jgi:uncharacterized protein (DUF2336 family)